MTANSIVNRQNLQRRFDLNYESASCRRLIGKKEVVIHCHHYNARLQNIIEGTHQIEGKSIILSAAEEVFSDYIKDFIQQEDDLKTKWQVAVQLYSHLCYGSLNLDRIDDDIITASSSQIKRLIENC